jgi:hypothetical protein
MSADSPAAILSDKQLGDVLLLEPLSRLLAGRLGGSVAMYVNGKTNMPRYGQQTGAHGPSCVAWSCARGKNTFSSANQGSCAGGTGLFSSKSSKCILLVNIGHTTFGAPLGVNANTFHRPASNSLQTIGGILAYRLVPMWC